MTKCPECGAEYFSSSDRCYACGARRQSVARRDPSVVRSNVRLVIGVVLLLSGAAIAIPALAKIGNDSNVDYQGIAVFGALIASVGIGLVVYAAYSIEPSLWRIHEGAMRRPWIPMAFLSAGLSLVIFAFGYMAILMSTSVLSRSEAIIGLAIEFVGAVFLLLGSAALVAGINFEDEGRGYSRRRRSAIGLSLIVLGIIFEVGLPLLADSLGVSKFLLALLFGMLVILAGLGFLTRPLVRPWVSDGYGAS